MALIGDIRVALGLDSQRFDRGIRDSSRRLEGLRDEGSKTDAVFSRLGRTLTLATVGFAGAKFASSVLETGGAFQSLKLRLQALTGSAEEATFQFNEFAKVAASTPFDLRGVVEAGVTLKAFGADAVSTIKPVADLAAFMGVDIPQAAQAFGRAFAAGAGAADVLRERGVLNLIKLRTGIQDLTKATLPQFRDALLKTMKDPAAGIAGSTNLLATSWEGAVSNMRDAWDQFKNSLADTGALTLATRAVKLLTAAIENLNENLTKNIIDDEKRLKFLNQRLADLRQHAPADVIAQQQIQAEIDKTTATIAKAQEFMRKGKGGAADAISPDTKKIDEARKAFDSFTGSIIDDIDKVRVEMEGQLFGEAAAETKALEIAFENLQKKFGSALPPDALAKFKELLGTLQAIKEASKIQALTLEQEFGFADIEDREAQEARNQLIEQEAARRIELKGIITELEKEVSLEVLTESARRVEAARRELDERLKLIEEWRQGAADAAVGPEGVAAVNQRAADLSALAWESATEKMKGETDEMTKFMERAIEGIQDAVAGGIFDLLQGNVKSWEDWGNSIKRVIDQVVSQFLAAQLNVALFGQKAGSGQIAGGGGLLGGLFGKIFGFLGFGGSDPNALNPFDLGFVSGRQHGGFVDAGNAFIVGETGPELFLPDVSGQILSNFDSMNLLGGMSGAVPSFQEGGIVGITQAPTREISDLGPSERLIAAHVGEQIVPAGERFGDRPTVIMNISTPDANSFRRSQLQIASEMETAIARGRRRRGGGS